VTIKSLILVCQNFKTISLPLPFLSDTEKSTALLLLALVSSNYPPGHTFTHQPSVLNTKKKKKKSKPVSFSVLLDHFNLTSKQVSHSVLLAKFILGALRLFTSGWSICSIPQHWHLKNNFE
jgi:hypothetical protein